MDPRCFNPETASLAIGARKVGAILPMCAAAAGVTEKTLRKWLQMGREYRRRVEAGETTDDLPVWHKDLADFVRKMEQAEAKTMVTLRQQVIDGSVNDPRLGWDMVKWREMQIERNARTKLLKAQAATAQKTLHADTNVSVTGLTDEQLATQLQRMLTRGAGAATPASTGAGEAGQDGDQDAE